MSQNGKSNESDEDESSYGGGNSESDKEMEKNDNGEKQESGQNDRANRPKFSYAQLIIQAIWLSENQEATLSQIYSYISQKYPYYKMKNKGWQNSIRHNLSLNSYFVKTTGHSSKECKDPSVQKGGYWKLNPLYSEKLVLEGFKTNRNRRMPPLYHRSPSKLKYYMNDNAHRQNSNSLNKKENLLSGIVENKGNNQKQINNDDFNQPNTNIFRNDNYRMPSLVMRNQGSLTNLKSRKNDTQNHVTMSGTSNQVQTTNQQNFNIFNSNMDLCSNSCPPMFQNNLSDVTNFDTNLSYSEEFSNLLQLPDLINNRMMIQRENSPLMNFPQNSNQFFTQEHETLNRNLNINFDNIPLSFSMEDFKSILHNQLSLENIFMPINTQQTTSQFHNIPQNNSNNVTYNIPGMQPQFQGNHPMSSRNSSLLNMPTNLQNIRQNRQYSRLSTDWLSELTKNENNSKIDSSQNPKDRQNERDYHRRQKDFGN